MSSELLIALLAVLFGSVLTAVGLLVRRGGGNEVRRTVVIACPD